MNAIALACPTGTRPGWLMGVLRVQSGVGSGDPAVPFTRTGGHECYSFGSGAGRDVAIGTPHKETRRA